MSRYARATWIPKAALVLAGLNTAAFCFTTLRHRNVGLPFVQLEAQVPDGPLDRSLIKDPKVVIKLSNQGNNPLHLSSLQILRAQQEMPSFQAAIGNTTNKSYELSQEATSLINQNLTLAPGHSLKLATFRPKEIGLNNEWTQELRQTLTANQIKIVTTHTNFWGRSAKQEFVPS